MSLKYQILTIIVFLFLCSGNYASIDVTCGANQTVAIAACKDYYSYGQLMPDRNYQTTGYRYGYQGQYAETNPETGFAHFEAREFDSRLGRWMIPDPAGQYWSPYMGMGNNPVSGVDPDGRLF